MSLSFRKFAVRFLAVASLMILTGFTVRAQSDIQGAVSGVVADQQSKVIVGAIVTVRNVATDVKSPGDKTDSNGRFIISNLQPGIYEITVTAANFADYKQGNIIVEVGRVTPLEIKLVIAGQTQTVAVTAEAPVINTETNDVSMNINTAALNNLPLNYRRWSYFTLLTPGAVAGDTFGDVSFLGIAYIFNNNTVDGADNNEYFFSSEKGRTRIAYSSSLNAIQEFQVSTADYSAEFGRAASGVINAVTKSGSNELHGTLYYYIRSLSFGGAYTPFVSASVQTSPGVYATEPVKPTDNRSQYGGDIGGWFFKNKLFYYFNFDGFYRDFPIESVPTGPNTFFEPITVAAPATSCSAISGQLSDQSGPNSGTAIGQALYCRIFNGGATTPTTGQIATAQTEVNAATNLILAETGLYPRTGQQTLYFPKLDWHIDKNDTATVSWNRLRWASPYGIQTGTAVADGGDYIGNDYVKDDTGIARLVTSRGASFTNELRFSYNRDFEFETQTPPVAGELDAKSTGLPPQVDLAYPTISGTAYSFGTYFNLPRTKYPDERKYEYTDTATFNWGKHLVKFGADVERTSDELINLIDQYGEYSYGNLADWISDYIGAADSLNPGGCTTASASGTCFYGNTTGNLCTSTENVSTNPNVPLGTVLYEPCYHDYFQGFGPNGFTLHTWDTAFFGQDDWHVARRFTVNFGLRWEHETMPQPQIPNAALPDSNYFPHDYKDWGPRIGFAWDVFGNGKTAVRGGYGIYYGRITNEQLYDAISLNGNTAAQLEPTLYPTTGNGTNKNGTPTCVSGPSISAPPSTCAGYAPDYPNIVTAPLTDIPALTAEFFAPDARLPRIQQFNLVIEHQIAANTVVSISYIGTVGSFLPIAFDTNLNTPSTLTYTVQGLPPLTNVGGVTGNNLPAAGSTFTVPFFTENTACANDRINCSLGATAEIATNVHSTYNALVLQFNRRMTHGLQFQMNYTWSHAIDDDQSSSPAFSGSTNTPLDPDNIALDKGNSIFNVGQRFVASIVWQPEYFSHSSKLTHALLDGWTLSPVQTAQNGLPYSGTVSGNPLSSTNYEISGVLGAGGSTRAPFLPRDFFHMPSIINTDIRLARAFTIKERYKAEVSVEVFNLFNQFDVTAVNTTLFINCSSASSEPGCSSTAPTLVYNPSTTSPFGSATAANNAVTLGARSFQFGGRFSF